MLRASLVAAMLGVPARVRNNQALDAAQLAVWAKFLLA
jgi:hypothetical protein